MDLLHINEYLKQSNILLIGLLQEGLILLDKKAYLDVITQIFQ